MTTKAAAEINFRNEDDPLKKLYTAIDELNEEIPLQNDRYRVSFNLNLFFKKEIASVYDAILQAKPQIKIEDYKQLENIVIKKLKEKELL